MSAPAGYFVTDERGCYPLVREALRRAADVLEEHPYLDPVQYLRVCAEELKDE